MFEREGRWLTWMMSAECFKCFDEDNDGKIPVEDLGLVIRALGKAPAESEVEAMEKEVGENGSVDYNAFKNFYRRKFKRPQELEQDMRGAFQALDATGKGLISEADLRTLIGTLGEALNSEQVDALLKNSKADYDGNISYDEFVTMLCQ